MTIIVDNYHTKLIVVYVSASLLFVVYALNKNENTEVAKTSKNMFEKLSIVIEEKLKKNFTKLGVYCATNPFQVLLIGIYSIKLVDIF